MPLEFKPGSFSQYTLNMRHAVMPLFSNRLLQIDTRPRTSFPERFPRLPAQLTPTNEMWPHEVNNAYQNSPLAGVEART